MSNHSDDPRNNDSSDENFADLFESYLQDMKDDISVGEQITGEIIAIGPENVFVDTGTKIDGVVEKVALLDENGELPYKVGDMISLYVVSRDDSEIRLSKVLTGSGGTSRLYDAHRNKIPVEGRILETCKGGFRVNVLGKTAFCPISQVDVAYVENPADYVGETYEFLITRIEERGRNIVISRRELLNRQIAAEREKFLKAVQTGDILDGRVSKIMPFGAFVTLAPGVDGMVHISELSWSRVGTPEEAVQVNDPVSVKVLSIEEAKDKTKPPKISLSIKQAGGDPWEKIHEEFHNGDKVTGTVTRCADFGAFVEIAPGLEGLVHISEMSYKRRILKAQDVVQPGETVAVMIKSIDPENRRISLSIKDAQGDPWIDIGTRYHVGDTISGTLEKKERFGYFITLEPGIVGLLPMSAINNAPNQKDLEKLKVNDSVAVTIESIQAQERKISLSAGDSMEKAKWQEYSADKSSAAGLGELGEKLKAALKTKE